MAGMYLVTDRWTTQDGEWFVSDKPYSIDQAHVDKWGGQQPDGSGCAICFFVKLVGGPANEVLFATTAGLQIPKPVDGKRWAHNEMYNPGSGYNPSNNVGPWSGRAKDAPSELADDVGLPGGHHVSTYVEMTWREEDGPTPPDPTPDPGPGPDTVQVMVKVGDTVYAGVVHKQGTQQ